MSPELAELSEAERRVDMLADLAATFRDRPADYIAITRDLCVAEMDLAYLRSGWEICRDAH